MRTTLKILALLPLLALTAACGRIDTGHVGVRTAWNGEIQPQEETQGFYTAFVSNVDEFTTKEVAVELFDMQPKAADNLLMKDLDIEIYYQTSPDMVADLLIKYTNRSGWDRGLGLPAQKLVFSTARDVVYDVVSKYKSLELHKNRDTIRGEIREQIQSSLNITDPEAFTITRVLVRNAETDTSIEEAIREAVAMNKRLEAKNIELDIANKQVQINKALTLSLTKPILRQRELEMLENACGKADSKCVFFLGEGGAVPMMQIK